MVAKIGVSRWGDTCWSWSGGWRSCHL